MKRTAATIYRFIFIFFSVWGICRKIGNNIFSWRGEIVDLTLFTDFLCFLTVLIVFIICITRKPGRFIRGIKAALTLASLIVFIINYPIFGSGITYEWILGILLPLMMMADWLLFDDKGSFRWYDMLLWIGGIMLLGAGLSWILKNLLGVSAYPDLKAIFGGTDIAKLIEGVVFGSIGMYLLDLIGHGMGKKGFRNIFSLIYRILYIGTVGYAFINSVGHELTNFISGLRYYELLINFLCAVCIGVIIIFNLIKYHSPKKAITPFPRLKAAFTVALLVIPVAHIAIGDRIGDFSVPYLIFCFISPLMMVTDWFLFDERGEFEVYDPLLWALFPILYFAAAVSYLIPHYGKMYERLFSLPQPEMFLSSVGGILIIGYILFLLDRMMNTGKK